MHIKKRATCFRILVPCHKRIEHEETGEEVVVLVGFKTSLRRAAVAEFRFLNL